MGQMKQAVTSLAFLMVVAGVIVGSSVVVKALDGQTESANGIDAIKANCQDIRGNLSRLHHSDAILRVNTGQAYNDLSSRLMARMNGRLAVNKIDASDLVSLTSRFEKGRSLFSSRYNEYESALAALLKIDCKNQPTDFYAQLNIVRDARLKLSSSVRELNDIIAEYGTKVEKIKEKLK